MRVLLTNDDGFDAEGLQALRRELIVRGARVTVLAPDGNRSGIGRSLTLYRPVTVERVGGDDENPVLACDGSPVDCVRIGLLSELVAPVDVVAAGINHGSNLGDDGAYSGTLGAALEGALLGTPAAGFSQEVIGGGHRLDGLRLHAEFPFAGVAAQIALGLADHPAPEGHALSVNFPVRADAVELRLTRPARRSYAPGFLEPIAGGPGTSFHPYGRPTDVVSPYEDDPDTDVAAVDAGCVSVSIVSARWGREPAAAENGWLESLAALAARAG